MLAIGRALMTNPRMLVMDEPSEGLAPAVIESLIEAFKLLEEQGMAILLIEQNLGMATALAERQLIMIGGRIAAETTAARALRRPGSPTPVPRRRAALSLVFPAVSRTLVLLSIVAAVAVGALAAGCGGDDEARPDLAFVSSRDGDYALFEMNADGEGQSRLTESDSDPSDPAGLFFQVEPSWSPDGSRIAFASQRSGNFDIYVMNADGTETRKVTSTKGNDSHPTWSSFGSDPRVRAGRRRVHHERGRGPDVTRISDPLVEESDPAWSPDGTWIAYVRRTPGTPVREIWLMRPNGSQRHAVTSQGARAFTPAWSPDSSRIVFSSNADSDVYALFAVGADGKGLRSVAPTVGDNFEPSWSPDGSKIAYQEDGAIFTVELGGGEVERLTDSANNDSSPVWNPQPPPAK